jgi:hypothetical protein
LNRSTKAGKGNKEKSNSLFFCDESISRWHVTSRPDRPLQIHFGLPEIEAVTEPCPFIAAARECRAARCQQPELSSGWYRIAGAPRLRSANESRMAPPGRPKTRDAAQRPRLARVNQVSQRSSIPRNHRRREFRLDRSRKRESTKTQNQSKIMIYADSGMKDEG